MRPLILACLAFVGSVLAQAPDVPYERFPNRSAPFNLVLLSSNSTLNGTKLWACHKMIETEALCTATSTEIRWGVAEVRKGCTNCETFYFNTSTFDSSWSTTVPELGDAGIITWIPVDWANTWNFRVRLSIASSPTRNVSIPLLLRGEGKKDLATYLGFDKEDKLFVGGYGDDTMMPDYGFHLSAYYNWYTCITDIGYKLETLAWVHGGRHPGNPSCQKVDVKRVWV